MAKQTYTTGQVLSAAQMTTLQANDYNQTVSAKVASYTLVAADAGTRITMSNASATTITVNTGLFAAGDTLYITNIGAGACTITAGTATVSTASSLVLAQYDSGVLYFTSAGVAIWQKYDGATPAAGGMTLIASGSLSTTQLDITSIPSTYKSLVLYMKNVSITTSTTVFIRVNNQTGSIYNYYVNGTQSNSSVFSYTASNSISASVTTQTGVFYFPAYTGTSGKIIQSYFMGDNTSNPYPWVGMCGVNYASSITEINLLANNAFDAGTYELYGVN